MSRKMYLSILVLIPLLVTGYSLQAETYPCTLKLGECLLSMKPQDTCSCVVVTQGKFTQTSKLMHDLPKKASGPCVLSNITFPNPICTK
jgi:hypothetical protein